MQAKIPTKSGVDNNITVERKQKNVCSFSNLQMHLLLSSSNTKYILNQQFCILTEAYINNKNHVGIPKIELFLQFR